MVGPVDLRKVNECSDAIRVDLGHAATRRDSERTWRNFLPLYKRDHYHSSDNLRCVAHPAIMYVWMHFRAMTRFLSLLDRRSTQHVTCFLTVLLVPSSLQPNGQVLSRGHDERTVIPEQIESGRPASNAWQRTINDEIRESAVPG